MQLLFDQNLSFKLVDLLRHEFPDSSHVRLLDMDKSSDSEIFDYAKDNNYTIVTQDSDFHEKVIFYGFPPQVIWIKTGNASTNHIYFLIKKNMESIENFISKQKIACLTLSGYF